MVYRKADSHIVKTKSLMWITPGRVLYTGLLGRPSVRRIGGMIVYVALTEPIRVSIDDGEWEEGDLVVVPPYMPHRITCQALSVTDLIIEPETVERVLLPSFMCDQQGVVYAPIIVERVQRVVNQFLINGDILPLDDAVFDELLFGESLPRATLDTRIARVLNDIAKDPTGSTSAENYASQSQLSFSRFVHLFKGEVGVPLRTFRSWKRARSMLHYVTQYANLADIAQHTGYPDSSHFSHSIRRVFGLSPKDVFAGSRRLDLHCQPSIDSTTARPKA